MLSVILSVCLAGALMAAGYFYLREKQANELKKQVEEKFKLVEQKNQVLELENIKYKLNPHLFKNTLNSIQSHAYQTYYSLDKLANVLDFILYESDRNFVTLKEEMEFLTSLIEINKLKVSPLFDLKIKNSIDVNDPFYNLELVAPLITIDLVENAFKHADLQSENAFISIVFELKDGVFYLSVSNKISDKPPIKKTNSGFGTQSFKKRLEIIYGKNSTFEQFTENNVYVSHLKINLGGHKDTMHIA
ncbi:MAG TPA: histidine kinase [Flavobacteriales bacterium]|nr:histidine kinase [Flavobacteriales bacterium]